MYACHVCVCVCVRVCVRVSACGRESVRVFEHVCVCVCTDAQPRGGPHNNSLFDLLTGRLKRAGRRKEVRKSEGVGCRKRGSEMLEAVG